MLLGAILVAITTTINMLGVKLMSRINNVGVTCELVGSSILVILLLFNAHHGPQIIFHSYHFGAGHPWGYFGALLVGGLLSAYVMYGFDTAGTLAEETNNPRKHAPPAIIRAIAAAAIIGGLVILLASMANKHILDKNIGLLGLPYVMKQAFGNTVGNIFLIDCAIAIFVCCLAVQTATIRMLFSMARDNRLPAGSAVARVSGHRKVPIVPALVTGGLTLRPAADQHRQPERVPRAHVARDHHVLHRVPRGNRPDAGQAPARPVAKARSRPVLLARALGAPGQHRGRGLRRADHDQHRLATNAIYNSLGTPHWYWQWSPLLFIGGVMIIGTIYYFTVQVKKGGDVLEEHRANVPDLDHLPPMGEMAP